MNHKNQTNSYTEFFYKAFRNILLISIPLVIIFALILSIPHSSATNSGSDNLAITISSSCTLSSVVNIPHSTEVYNGNYLGNIGKTTITTLCNDGNGYSVYAVGYSNNEEGNNKLINTEYPQYSIDTGLATSGLTSTWAMKLNNIENDPSPTPPTIETPYNDIYGLVPSYWTKVASRASGTTDMAQGSSFTTTYAVYANSSQFTGTYNGQVKYMLVHPSYKPAIYFMQDVASWKKFLNLEESVQAIDKRDGKSYWVTKLKDGNVWMTQNLDLDLIQNKTYTHADTDLGWTPNNVDVSATWILTTNPTTISASPYYVDPGDKYVYTSNSNADDTVYDSLSECTATEHTDCEHYHIGNYYNWSAARANSNDASICPAGWRLPSLDSNEYGNLLVNYNIIGTNTDTTYLTNGFNIIRQTPLYFVRAGSKGPIESPIGVSGSYFYNKTTKTTYASYMNFKYESIAPIKNNVNQDIERYAYSVRCVAR